LNFTRHSKLFPVALAIIALALTATTFAAITVTSNVSSTGTIVTQAPNIGVFSDSACTIAKSSITWGSVNVGSSTTQTVYVKNTGTVSMTLSLSSSNWTPTNANTYITVSWDKQGVALAAGQSTPAVITLTASSATTGITTFSNTITLSGTG
jgi:hypothetical protein